ncbi:MAG TPA: 5-formyltetrahydrofolate cyclo-ligase [Casimicrobiaceae bacterium]|nr:5-formyltetrahydrofolate cyclo-ligase [Casimicrobiaceae bacterium]
MSLRDDKRALRERLVAQRDALGAEARAEASQAIARNIASLEGYGSARVVLLTLPFRSEWDALLVARHALAAGKIVVAPRVDPTARTLRPLRIVDLDRDVESGYRGIPEPCATCAAVALQTIDWVLTPGVGFDAAGRRLGYGGGYYDRLLPLLPRAASRVAGAFEVQLVDRVPAAPHDIGVDCIVTEQRIIDCARMPA